MNLFRVVIELVAKDKASAVVGKTTKSIQQAGKAATTATASFKNLAGAFTSLVVAGRVRAAMEALITPARKMETSMMRLGWLTNKATAELGFMRREAERVAKVTVYGPQESVDAMAQLVRATGSAETAMGALHTSAGLAMASFGKMKLEKSSQMVSSMAKSFSMSGDEIGAAGDKLMAVTKATGVGVEELRDVMGYLGTAAIRGGQNFEQMLMSFSLARRVLPSSRRAATQLMRVMGELSSTKAQNALEAIGIRTSDLAGNIRPMSEVMLDLSDAAARAPLQVRDALNEAFGQAAVKPMFAMLAQLRNGFKTMTGETLYGAQVFSYLNDQIKNSSGAVKEAGDRYMQTADAGIRRMAEAWEMVKTALGEAILPQLGKLAKSLATALTALIDFGRALPGPVKWLLKSAGFIALVGAGVTALRMAWVSLSNIYKAAIAYTGQIVATTTQSAVAANTAAAAQTRLAGAYNMTSTAAVRYAGAQRAAAAASASSAASSVAGAAGVAVGAVSRLGGVMRGVGGFLRSNWLGIVLLAAPTIMDWMTKLYKKYTDYTKKMMAEAAGISGERAKKMSEKEIQSEWQWKWHFGDISQYKGKKRPTGKWAGMPGGPQEKWQAQNLMTKAMSAGTLKEAKAIFEPAIYKALNAPGTKKAKWDEEERRKWLEFEFKKRFEFNKKLEAVKDQMDARRRAQQEQVWRKAKNWLMLGTKPFEKAISKLEQLTSYEPKDVKTSSIVTIMKYMDAIQRKGVGGRVGRGVALSEGDIRGAKGGKKGMEMFTDVLRRAIAGEKLTGTEVTAGLGGAMQAINLLKATRSMPNEQIKKMQETTVEALISQLKGPARASAMAWLQSGQGISTRPGKGAVGGFVPGMGGFAQSPAMAVNRIKNMPSNVHYMFDGRMGLAGAGESPLKAAGIGAAEQFPQYVGPGATKPMPGGQGTIADIVGGVQKPFQEEIKKLTKQYQEMTRQLKELNTAAQVGGIKVKPAEGTPEWREAMRRGLNME